MKPHWLDRLILQVSPAWAMKRHGTRMLFKTLADNDKGGWIEKRAFDSVSGNRIRHDWVNYTQDADTANIPSLSKLRNTIRILNQNTGIISGPLRRITNYVIGTGLRPQAKARVDADKEIQLTQGTDLITEETAQAFNYQIERAWRNWIDKADAQMRLNFYELQALAFRAMYADGEVLIAARSSNKYGRIVPLCFEVIEIDRLATPTSEISNSKIRNGIEFDEEGVPVRYYVLKRHPGASYSIPRDADYEQIEAFQNNGQKKLFHLYNVLRPGQSRGYPALASALEDIQDRKRLREARIVAERVAACLAAFIKSPAAYAGYNQLPSNADGQKIEAFEPGMVKYLLPGEEITFADPNRPGTQVVEFLKHIDREISNSADIPYEILTGDFGNLNYSNARTVWMLAFTAIRAYQAQFIDHFCYPAWELFATDCLLKGLVNAPGFESRMKDYCNSQWIPPKRDWIDPSSESEAAKTDLEINITTLADIITSQGGDWEETLEQIAKEKAKKKELETKYGIKFGEEVPKPMPAGKEGNA